MSVLTFTINAGIVLHQHPNTPVRILAGSCIHVSIPWWWYCGCYSWCYPWVPEYYGDSVRTLFLSSTLTNKNRMSTSLVTAAATSLCSLSAQQQTSHEHEQVTSQTCDWLPHPTGRSSSHAPVLSVGNQIPPKWLSRHPYWLWSRRILGR
jgi:hypothetical protein